MGTQGAGRKRLPNRERLTAEDDALNQIAREVRSGMWPPPVLLSPSSSLSWGPSYRRARAPGQRALTAIQGQLHEPQHGTRVRLGGDGPFCHSRALLKSEMLEVLTREGTAPARSETAAPAPLCWGNEWCAAAGVGVSDWEAGNRPRRFLWMQIHEKAESRRLRDDARCMCKRTVQLGNWLMSVFKDLGLLLSRHCIVLDLTLNS